MHIDEFGFHTTGIINEFGLSITGFVTEFGHAAVQDYDNTFIRIGSNGLKTRLNSTVSNMRQISKTRQYSGE